jgi:hypothetical protein
MSGFNPEIDLSKAQTASEWVARLDELGEELGYFEPLGSEHVAFFSDMGTTLLVSFETVAGIRAGGGNQRPLGFQVASGKGWSSLTVVARADTWFRDKHVWGYIDRLIDEAFFEDFDRVVFYGSGMGGYAAAAFSCAAPGATVVAVSPQATLDPALADWDTRFLRARRLDFTSRFGFAPKMTDGASDVFVIYDPSRKVDAMHAALFNRDHVTKLRVRGLGRDTAADLEGLAILRPTLEAACTGTLTAQRFYGMFRSRRRLPSYLARLSLRADSMARPRLTAIAARMALALGESPRIRQTLERAEQALDA